MKQLLKILFSILFSFSVAYILFALYVFIATYGQEPNIGFIAYSYQGLLFAIPFIAVILLIPVYKLLSQKGKLAKITAIIGGACLLYALYQLIPRLLSVIPLYFYKTSL